MPQLTYDLPEAIQQKRAPFLDFVWKVSLRRNVRTYVQNVKESRQKPAITSMDEFFVEDSKIGMKLIFLSILCQFNFAENFVVASCRNWFFPLYFEHKFSTFVAYCAQRFIQCFKNAALSCWVTHGSSSYVRWGIIPWSLVFNMDFPFNAHISWDMYFSACIFGSWPTYFLIFLRIFLWETILLLNVMRY